MMDTHLALRADNISKCYRIGMKEAISDSMSGAVINFIKSPLKNFRNYRALYNFDDLKGRGAADAAEDVIWALKDVSFEVRQGDTLGFVGRNGAGKSTLLKVLSRITDPTSGRAEIRGRVSSLLEVGTGFHKELTGRENIYLNGTILGMKKREVDQKFDEILDFSGVEKFVDTPVKRYSSGMKVRLAFSVAAHLEPEILIVDEVLAVGDAEFQKKCLNKMEAVGEQGRTVLFVSHNMPALTRLCRRAILIENGRITREGSADEVVRDYLTAGTVTPAYREWPDPETAPGGQVARLRSVKVCGKDEKVADIVNVTETFRVEMKYEVLQGGFVLNPHFYFWSQDGICIFGSADLDPVWRGRPRPPGWYVSTVEIPGNLLRDGLIYVSAGMVTLGPSIKQFGEQAVVTFRVVDFAGVDSARGDFGGEIPGLLRPKLNWSTNFRGSMTGKSASQT